MRLADGEDAQMKPKLRQFLNIAGALAMNFPAVAVAQQPLSQMPRIGLLAWWPCEMPYASETSEFGSFMRGLFGSNQALAAGPGIQIGQRSCRQGALLGDRFGRAAQPLP